MKTLAPFSLLLALFGNVATAAEVMPPRDSNSVGGGYGGVTGMMLGAAAGGPIGAIAGGLAGIYAGKSTQKAVTSIVGEDEKTYSFDGDRSDAEYDPNWKKRKGQVTIQLEKVGSDDSK